MDETTIRPYALPAGQGWTYHFAELGIDFVVKVGEQRQGRRLAVFELTTRSGEEPPEHTHATEDEIFYVLEGELVFRCGGERFEVADGGCAFLPRGIPHGYEVISPGDVKLLVLTAPAPDDGTRGWDGFVGSFERHSEQRKVPPPDRG
jgi:quercetin dioxygenase-like cupin family protein